MTQIYFNIKNTIILAIFVFAFLFLPSSLFSQGAIVGYADGNKHVNSNNLSSFPSNAQLDRLNHVIAVGLGVNVSGTLKTSDLPNYWNGNTNTWLASLVSRAHQRDVEVSISITGESEFNAATETPQRRNAFVSEIVDFINDNGLDGVEINWEHPRDSVEWSHCILLLAAINSELPNKKLSISLQVAHPGYDDVYPTQTPPIPEQIWEIADAINLMTYDDGSWPTHSDADEAIEHIGLWGIWGTTEGRNLCKGELFVGSAFYGWHPVVGEEDGGFRVSYRDYILNNDTTWYSNPGDSITDVQDKAIHTRDNGFGGVFIWELGYDLTADDSQSLLKAIDEVMPSFSGPTIVCNTWVNYTIDNIPQGATLSWDKSANLILSNKMPPFTYRVRAASTAANGPGWVKAIITGSCDTISLIKHVWVGTPPGNVAGPYVWQYGQELQVHCLEPGQWATMRLINTHPDVTDYSWTLFDESEYPIMLGNGPTSMPFTISGNYPPRYVEVSYGIDGCSWSTNQKYVSLCGGVLRLVVHPNPASHIITITETDAEMNDLSPWILRLTSSLGIVMTTIRQNCLKLLILVASNPGFISLMRRRGNTASSMLWWLGKLNAKQT